VKVIVPPIKSQGIKTKLLPWIHSILPSTYNTFIEPFCGTGCVSFNTEATTHYLNDINPYLINFYSEIKNGIITSTSVREYLEFNSLLLEKNGDSFFKEIRKRFNDYHNSLDFLFLSRACFNGLIRFNKKGEYNTPFCRKNKRFSKSYITKIVNQVDNVAKIINNNWEFTNEDFKVSIEKATKNDLLYIDPPYLGLNSTYFSTWDEKDEELLFLLLNKTPAKFILSTWHHNDYRTNLSIDKYWKHFKMLTSDHFYYIGGKEENRKPMVEALVYNF
jgi:DNA adenine methylase